MFYFVKLKYYFVFQAIIRLEPNLKPEIDSLISSPLTNVGDMIDYIRLQKELEKNKQHMVIISRKLDTLEIEKNNIKGFYDLL